MAAMLFAACGSEPDPLEPWNGACDPDAARVTGDLEGQPIDLTVSENYGYQTYPALWAWLIDDDVRLTVAPNDLDQGAAGPSRGVIVLGPDEPLHCATRDTNVRGDPPRGQLRTLRRLGSCPGTEVVDGTIEGCTNGSEGCRVSGGPLPEAGVDIYVTSFSQDGAQYTFQMELSSGKILDFDNVRGGGTVFYAGEVFCVGDVSIGRVGESYEFSFGDLTRLGCDEAPEVSGSIDVCVPPI